MIVSTFEIVTVLLKSPRISLSVPPPRSMEPLAIARERDLVDAADTDDRLDVGDGARVGHVGERQAVVARAEIDAVTGGEDRRQRDWSSLVPPTIVSTLVSVTMLAKLPSVSLSEPRVEIDRGV